MGPLSYMLSVVDRNVFKRHINHLCTWSLLHISTINHHLQRDIMQIHVACVGFTYLLLENGDLSPKYVAAFMCVNESWFILVYPTLYTFVSVLGLLWSQCTERIILNLCLSWWIGKDTERNGLCLMYCSIVVLVWSDREMHGMTSG